jgi:predicted Rossmann fold flavoprotein
MAGVSRAIRAAEFGRAVAEERARVAREIHDGLAQYLFSISTHVTMLESGSQTEATVARLKEAALAAQQEARFAVLALSSASGTAPFDAALRRYTQHDFIALVDRYGIAWHEKTLGQLFCDGSSQQVIDMLLAEMRDAGVALELETSVETVERSGDGFTLGLNTGPVRCTSLVAATGGKSIPKMGATGYAYGLARQFDVPVTETRPALVPLTFETGMLEKVKPLSGISVDVVVGHGKTRFSEAMLFTHRGLSGPAILQISSYWREGEDVVMDMAPGIDFSRWLNEQKRTNGRQSPGNALASILPKRLAQFVAENENLTGTIADLGKAKAQALENAVKAWRVRPVGSEGYRTAEVTLGGIDTDALNSQDMQVKAVPGLYFIGEAVDVTGWLGGYNFQWAWSSGWAAGQAA